MPADDLQAAMVAIANRPEPVQCGGVTTKGRPCRALCKVVQYNTSEEWFDLSGLRYWQLSGCKDHMSDNDKALIYLVEQITETHRKAARVAQRYVEIEADLRMAEADNKLLLMQQQRDVGLPACWSWFTQPHPLPSAPANLTELEQWQQARCAVCGRVTPLIVDHDHWSGLVRGFLCRDCNKGEGGERRIMDGPIGGYRQVHPARWFRLSITYGSGMWRSR